MMDFCEKTNHMAPGRNFTALFILLMALTVFWVPQGWAQESHTTSAIAEKMDAADGPEKKGDQEAESKGVPSATESSGQDILAVNLRHLGLDSIHDLL